MKTKLHRLEIKHRRAIRNVARQLQEPGSGNRRRLSYWLNTAIRLRERLRALGIQVD